jgi:hypothetical protein
MRENRRVTRYFSVYASIEEISFMACFRNCNTKQTLFYKQIRRRRIEKMDEGDKDIKACYIKRLSKSSSSVKKTILDKLGPGIIRGASDANSFCSYEDSE